MKPLTFTAFGGTIGIDFTNTVQQHRGRTVNLLSTPDDVIRWLEFMRHEGRLPTESWDTLAPGPWPIAPLIQCRCDVRGFLEGKIPHDELLAILTQTVAVAPLAFRAIEDQHRARLIAIPTQPGTQGLLSLLAFDWLNLVVSSAASAVSRCQNKLCLAYFLDLRGRRKWCSMDTCGNRHKNARHYARRNLVGLDEPGGD